MTAHTSSPTADTNTDANLSPQLTVDRLYDTISSPNDLLLLDVRNDDEFEAWRIESRHTPETIHIPYFEFLEDEAGSLERVPGDRDVVVVCAKGGASDYVAGILRDHGVDAVNLAGGMIDWGNYYVTRAVVENDLYQIYQVDRVARGCLSHILISQGEAAIIDPLRHINQYREFLVEHDAELTLILDTHAHADHISGGPDLADATGAAYYLHPYDGIHPFDMLPARIEYNMLHDGQAFSLGNLDIRAIHVPGHTLGQVNFLTTGSDNRSYFFTGDSIFIESFGRPDLGGQGERWAPLVYEAIFETTKQQVPADALVLPGHYARADEAGDDGVFGKPLADLWVDNPGLRFTDKDEFIEYVLGHLPWMPEEYVEIKRVNAGLSTPDEDEAGELELGKNICAVSG